MPRPASTLCLAALALAGAACAQDQSAVVRFVDAFPAQEKFDRPLLLTQHAKDPGWLWVLEQTGRLLRVPADGKQSERRTVLDLGKDAFHPGNGGHNEEGLLGFCFDPGYLDSNAFVYVYWSRKIGGSGASLKRESVISRFTTKRDGEAIEADRASELVVMRVPQPWGNHNGGTILFGRDGMLYIALGDGGAANDLGGTGQNLASLLAKVLRIDVRGATSEKPYAIPSDNPFVGREGARGETWCYGLRNPWRISFDRETGELWCGDVGQNLFEEVDRLVKGGNYGWPLMEATHTFPPNTERKPEELAGLVAPVAEYPRGEGISITGGHVYRGKALPQLVGRFVYGDFALCNVWAVLEDRESGKHDVLRIGKAPAPLASFGERENGELVICCFDGRIYDLVPSGAKSD
ncbi:MAG: PQQ-dependent sugar dehydrogenase [Planctomycetes bacterium]|nr:PQQ-dependent sugar dehydrogenase [Planctomycetota bacterium]